MYDSWQNTVQHFSLKAGLELPREPSNFSLKWPTKDLDFLNYFLLFQVVPLLPNYFINGAIRATRSCIRLPPDNLSSRKNLSLSFSVYLI